MQDGYFDPQVNGFAGVDFNDDALTLEQLRGACEALRAGGVEWILATVITDAVDRMEARLRRLARFRREDPLIGQVIAGLHIEGPFLSPETGYIGAHPPQHARPADVATAARLVDAGAGLVRIVTLAPEQDPGAAVTHHLSGAGIVVSAGHTNASLDQLREAIDGGLRMFTHLGNGCPVQLPRHDNIIQRVLSLADRLTISFIGDGHHIPWFALNNYLRLVPFDEILFTTDAIAAAGLGPGRYQLGELEIHVGDDGVPRMGDTGQLAGSTATMRGIANDLQQQLGMPQEQLRAVLRDNLMQLLGRGGCSA